MVVLLGTFRLIVVRSRGRLVHKQTVFFNIFDFKF